MKNCMKQPKGNRKVGMVSECPVSERSPSTLFPESYDSTRIHYNKKPLLTNKHGGFDGNASQGVNDTRT